MEEDRGDQEESQGYHHPEDAKSGAPTVEDGTPETAGRGGTDQAIVEQDDQGATQGQCPG
jgi:hypothetical protein